MTKLEKLKDTCDIVHRIVRDAADADADARAAVMDEAAAAVLDEAAWEAADLVAALDEAVAAWEAAERAGH
tara:strand:- start:4183 stop:4395 length:213 start_codon:yes stop_codon:yes gene_type:complete